MKPIRDSKVLLETLRILLSSLLLDMPREVK